MKACVVHIIIKNKGFEIVGLTQKIKDYFGSPLFLSNPKDWHGITRRVHGIAAGVWHHAPACIYLRIDSIQGLRLDSIPQTSCGFHTRLRSDYLKLHFLSEPSNRMAFSFCFFRLKLPVTS